MLFKIATVLSLLSVCTGESLLQFQNDPSKHAISSQSFHREDVPLSYKYSAIHVYSTPKPNKTGHEPHISIKNYPPAKPVHSEKFPHMQYAPLIDTAPLYTKVVYTNSQRTPTLSNNHAYETTLKKDHLEPKIMSVKSEYRGQPISSLDYIPGQNIHVMQSVNRIPGHNAVYRSYSDNAPNDKLNKVNYLRQYLIYQNAQRLAESASQKYGHTETTTTKTAQSPRPTESAKIHLLKPIEYVALESPNMYNTDVMTKMVEVPQPAHKIPYQKIHSLFLNVARSYNFMPTALHNGANPSILGRSQFTYLKPLLRVPGSSTLEATAPEKKTLVFPIQKNRHFAIHS